MISTTTDTMLQPIISTMLEQELQYLSVHHLHINRINSKDKENAVLQTSTSSSSSFYRSIVDVSTREQICKWIFHIIERVEMQRETAIIAMNYLDRFMSTSVPRARRARYNRREYQLVALTCLYIAVKITEPIVMGADMIRELSRGAYSIESILSCERHILASLRWKLNGPTPFQFIDYMIQLLPEDTCINIRSKLAHDARRQVEVAVHDAACVPLRRSTISISSVLNSIEDSISLDKKTEFIQQISDTVGYDIEDSPMIKACRKRLQDRSERESTKVKQAKGDAL